MIRRVCRASLPALLAAILPVVGCMPPDQPVAATDRLPDGAVEFLGPDTVRTLRVAPGVTYRYLWSPVGPWAVHVLEADMASCRVGFSVVRAPGSPGTDDARLRVSRMMEAAPEGAVAAVNGDFFTLEGAPQGPEITEMGYRGDSAAGTDRRPAFSWNRSDGPRIGTVASLEDPPARMSTDLRVAVAGFPELLDGGARVGDLEVGSRRSFAGVRHPRTAVAYDDETNRLWIVVVEGRLGARSAGMTLPELTGLLEGLGAEDALNLDGGGSSVMVLGSRPVSRPSDEEGERPVVNALVVQSAPAYCRG